MVAAPVQTVINPNLGLKFDRPPLTISERAFQDGMNFRCKNGTVESRNLGWTKFSTINNWQLNGTVSLISNFFPRNLNEQLIFGTSTDLYLYHSDSDTVTYLTPVYTTGTASCSGSTVTGTGTLWSTNCRIADEISFGSNAQNNPAATWYKVAHVTDDTHFTTVTAPGTVTNGPYTLRRKFQNAIDNNWSFDVFVNDGSTGYDLWTATNGLDWVVTWNAVDTFATSHPELGFTCKCLCAYKDMMIYGNITQSGNNLFSSIINSDVGYPLHAGSTATGLSEQFQVHAHTDDIVSLVNLGDYLICYSLRNIVPIQFVGSPLIFRFRAAISGIGPISSNAIADFGSFHEFVAHDAGYMFDGVTLKQTNQHVWREILRQADPARRQQAYAHFDEENGDLIWSIPGNTDAGVGTIGAPAAVAWVEHYLEPTGDPNFEGSPYSKRSFPFTITGFYQKINSTGTWNSNTGIWDNAHYAWNDQFLQAAFPTSLAGDQNGYIYQINSSQTANGVALPSFIRTNRWFMTDGRSRDLLTRVYPFAHTFSYPLDIKLYMSDFVGATPQLKNAVQFDMTQLAGANAFVVFYRRGRTAELSFGSDAGNPWILDGWSWDKRQGGQR